MWLLLVFSFGVSPKSTISQEYLDKVVVIVVEGKLCLSSGKFHQRKKKLPSMEELVA